MVLHQGGTPTQRGASKFLGLSHYALHTMEGLINKLTINTFVFTIYLMSGGAWNKGHLLKGGVVEKRLRTTAKVRTFLVGCCCVGLQSFIWHMHLPSCWWWNQVRQATCDICQLCTWWSNNERGAVACHMWVFLIFAVDITLFDKMLLTVVPTTFIFANEFGLQLPQWQNANICCFLLQCF